MGNNSQSGFRKFSGAWLGLQLIALGLLTSLELSARFFTFAAPLMALMIYPAFLLARSIKRKQGIGAGSFLTLSALMLASVFSGIGMTSAGIHSNTYLPLIPLAGVNFLAALIAATTRPAQATDGDQSRANRSWPYVITAATLIISYVLIPFFELGLLISLAGLIYLLVNRRWTIAAILILLCPVTVLTAWTTVDTVSAYRAGSAKYLYVGLPGRESNNLHPGLRVDKQTMGCMSFSYQFITRNCHNWLLRKLIEESGPMPGSYQGPYPDRAQAYKLIRDSGFVMDTRDYFKGEIKMDGETYRLAPETAAKSIKEIQHGPTHLVGQEPEVPQVKLKVLDGQCLIVSTLAADPRKIVVLIDLAGSRIFARYFWEQD